MFCTELRKGVLCPCYTQAWKLGILVDKFEELVRVWSGYESVDRG